MIGLHIPSIIGASQHFRAAADKMLGNGLAAPGWIRKAFWFATLIGAAGEVVVRMTAWIGTEPTTAAIAAGSTSIIVLIASAAERGRSLLQRWMPIVLVLSGINLGQST